MRAVFETRKRFRHNQLTKCRKYRDRSWVQRFRVQRFPDVIGKPRTCECSRSTTLVMGCQTSGPVIQLGKITVSLWLSWACMKIGQRHSGVGCRVSKRMFQKSMETKAIFKNEDCNKEALKDSQSQGNIKEEKQAFTRNYMKIDFLCCDLFCIFLLGLSSSRVCCNDLPTHN